MFGYTSTLDMSMNGIKTLSDGISIISDGTATHDNIFYNQFIKSQDLKTVLLNNSLTTENIDCLNLTSDNIDSTNLNTDEIMTISFTLKDYTKTHNLISFDGYDSTANFNLPTTINDTLSIINKNLIQTQSGTIQQSGTGTNNLKDSNINGFLNIGSNITQTGGSSVLKDLNCDNITQNTNKGITQSGSGVSNTFGGTTTVRNLTILDSVSFPSNVTIPGTTTNDDIVMEDDSVITQDTTFTTTKYNLFRYSKFLDVDIDGNINQTKAGSTTTLKNSTIQGSLSVQGDITQTTGSTSLKTISCNNITLNTDNDINLSGTGKINQSGTGINSMSAITLISGRNLTLQGSGIISQALNGTNILSNSRIAGFNIIQGKNNSTNGLYQNIQNNNGLQLQFNRDNSTGYSFLMNHKGGFSGNGGFRFQRYNGSGVYIDEPFVIDDKINFYKDVELLGKSLTCGSATIGNITQTELDTLDNNDINIKNKFNSLDTQITDLQNSSTSLNSALTGISYNNSNDTTSIDNNLNVVNTLTLGTTNINSFITDTNTFNSAVSNTLQGIVYTSGNDTTTINNNVVIPSGKKLYVEGMDIKQEIDNLDTSFTTGTINSSDLTTSNLTITKSLIMTDTIECVTNTIISSSFPKSISNKSFVINAGSMTISNMKKVITFTTPISVYRQYVNVQAGPSFTNNIEDSLNSISYTVLKNGSTFTSGTCSLNNNVPKLIGISSASSTTSRNYEVFMTNASILFTPTFSSSNDNYSFVLTVDYDVDIIFQQSNIIIEEFGYYANTSISGTTTTLSIGFPGNNFSSANYSLTTPSSYLVGNGTSKFNEIVSNSIDNQNTITTNNLITLSVTTGNLTSTNSTITNSTITNLSTTNLFTSSATGLYCFTASEYTYSTPFPFFCSTRNLSSGLSNVFIWYVLFPGYRVRFFINDANYIGNTVYLEDSNLTNSPKTDFFPSSGSPSYRNNIEGIRLYRYINNTWSEITITNIS